MACMKSKILFITICLWALSGCVSRNNSPVPTLIPTAWIEATATPLPALPATNTPIATLAANEGEEAILEVIDQETCQEALTTQQELEDLQAQGEDVAELATAVAELITELDNCEILLTPTPLNQ